MKHVLVIIAGPPLVYILQIARAVHEYHGRAATTEVGRLVEARVHRSAIARGKRHDWRIGPWILPKVGRWRGRELFGRSPRPALLNVYLGRLVRVRIQVGQPALVRRWDYAVTPWCGGDPGTGAAIGVHHIHLTLAETHFTGSEIEARSVFRQMDTCDFPIA